MPAAIHLILGPSGADRVGRLLAAYQHAAAQFQTAMLLTPTRRLADQLRDRLTTYVAPAVLHLQGFADELIRRHDPAIRPHSEIDRRLLLDAVLSELREGSDMPYFVGVSDTRGYAEAAAGYVAELKDAGVDLRQLLKACPHPETGVSPNRHLQATRIYAAYHRRLAKLHRLDGPDRIGRAAALWKQGKRQPFDRVRTVFAAGFTALTHLQQQLLDVLRDSSEKFCIELPDGEGEPFRGPNAIRHWLATPVGERSLFNPTPALDVERVEDSAKPRKVIGLQSLFGELETPAPVASAEAPSSTANDVAAEPLHLIEAAGEMGEARLVARRIRMLLAAGAAAHRILVVPRRLSRPRAELYREVFHEYDIPHEIEGADALNRVPAVAFLQQAWRLPAEDWPFPLVAAILRSSYFRPNWPEVQSDPEIAARAEDLLRLLGEPRGKDAFLAAVRTWEQTPPEPLEDEHAEEPLRQRKQRLAARCRPFLQRFFNAWSRIKPSAAPESVVGQLRAFADDLGLTAAACKDPRDAEGLTRLWRELERWAKNETSAGGRKRADRFARVLAAMTMAPCRARTGRNRDSVQLLSAEAAAGLDCDYLFLIGLGEGSWPDLSPPVSLLDDPERERLRKLNFLLADPAARLGAEQLLFLSLITAPQRGLVLSRAGVDDRGEPLLPGSFLRELMRWFGPNAVPTTRQHMLLEGYFQQAPLSRAELRIQAARHWKSQEALPQLLPALAGNLHRAAAVADERFRTSTHGPFDGVLSHPAVGAVLAERFSTEKVLSPTALETYVACPFRFLLDRVLRLEPHEDPVEHVESTRRGAAFHRALARLHINLDPEASQDPSQGVTDELVRQIELAVEEYAQRAPSRASAELWRLEGKRLCRSALRYRTHWRQFREPWKQTPAAPRPYCFEAGFGAAGEDPSEPLVVEVDGVAVRIGGRIDRVDVAELDGGLGFWVIDYKTGRSINYQPSQVERLEKLQLPLYALAVERVLFKDRPARPLGLAYWLVTADGVKPVLPSKKGLLTWLNDRGKWERFRQQLEAWVATLATQIRTGRFPLSPRSEYCTDTCGFGPVCRIAQCRNTGKTGPLELPMAGNG
jgi:ATP-dependent helicase/DNAse subunit B